MTSAPVRFLFRLAAGPRIGFGHLVRCRALARALEVRPLVSIRGGAGARRTARALGCDLAGGGALSRADLLIVDDPSPRHTATWLRRARRAGRPAATIHDLRTGRRAADLVIDGRVTAGPSCRGGTALLGPRFTVLDPEVALARAARRPRRAARRPRVLIALGGGAHVFAVVQSLVDGIARRAPGVSISVAAGFSRRRPPSLRGARWLARPDGLARDLAHTDVAVVGGGVTLYEACAIGAPAVALAVVPAQRAAIRAFAARGAAIDAGALVAGARAVVRAAAAVAALLGDASARRRRSAASRRLIDGRGASRVAARMRSLARTAARGRGHRV